MVGEHAEGLAVAIAGTGFTGRVHARAALVNGARLAGVSASTPRRASEAATALGARRAYADDEELVSDPDVQVVHVCTPNHLHAGLVRAAIEAGKHVICEKPLAPELAVAQELLHLSEQRGVVATVPYVYRYYAMVREARIRIQSGLVGRAVLVHGSYLQDWLIDPEETNWRVDPTLGGRSRSFADIGTHWCDLAEFITGDRIQRVRSDLDIVVPTRPDPRGSGPTFSPSPPASSRAGASGLGLSGSGPSGPAVGVTTEDAAVVQFRTEGGALGSVVVSQVAAGHSNHLQLEVLGADGSLTFDSQRPDQISIGHDGGMTVSRRDPRRLSPEAARYSRLPAGHPQGYQDCVDAFVGETYQAVRSGVVDPLLPTFAVGVRAAAVTDAVLRAAKADGWVTVADLAPATKD